MGQSIGKQLGNMEYKLQRGKVPFKRIWGISFVFTLFCVFYYMFMRVEEDESGDKNPKKTFNAQNIILAILYSIVLSFVGTAFYKLIKGIEYGTAKAMCKNRTDGDACIQQQLDKQEVIGAIARK